MGSLNKVCVIYQMCECAYWIVSSVSKWVVAGFSEIPSMLKVQCQLWAVSAKEGHRARSHLSWKMVSLCVTMYLSQICPMTNESKVYIRISNPTQNEVIYCNFRFPDPVPLWKIQEEEWIILETMNDRIIRVDTSCAINGPATGCILTVPLGHNDVSLVSVTDYW